MKKNKTATKLQLNAETVRKLEQIPDLSGVQGGIDVVVTQKTALAAAGGSWLLCCTGK